MSKLLAKLKANKGSSLQKLLDDVDKMDKGKSYQNKDERFWQPTVDSSGNGYAIIRLLPGLGGEDDMPYVRVWSHGFKGPTGSWYIENSRTTIGEDDPVSDYNTKLWNSGDESDKEIARKQKRRLHYISNILVVSDPANPDNDGKVFLYKYGQKIFEKCKNLMAPEFPDEEPVDPFCPFTGANLRLKIRNVANFRNYDKSEFDTPTPLAKTEKAMGEILDSQNDLNEFVAPDQFKSYEELERKLFKVLGISSGGSSATKSSMKKEDPPFDMGDSSSIIEDDDVDVDEILQSIGADKG